MRLQKYEATAQAEDQILTTQTLFERIKQIPAAEREAYEKRKREPNRLPVITLPSDTLGQASTQTDYVMSWFEQVAPDIVTFNSENFFLRLNDASVHFTPYGFSEFLRIRSPWASELSTQEYKNLKIPYPIKASIIGKPKLLSEYEWINRHWVISAELKVEFGHITMHGYSSTRAIIIAGIIQSDDPNNKHGIAIDKIVLWATY